MSKISTFLIAAAIVMPTLANASIVKQITPTAPADKISQYKLFSGDSYGKIKFDFQRKSNIIELKNKVPSLFCTLIFRYNITYKAGMLLSFDYKILPGKTRRVGYLGINLTTRNNKRFFFSARPSSTWKKAEVPLSSFKAVSKKALLDGDVIREIVIYARAIGNSESSKGVMTLAVDDFKLIQGTPLPEISKKVAFAQNFNKVASLSAIRFVGSTGDGKVNLVNRKDENDKALQVINTKPSEYCSLIIKCKIPYQPGIVLSFSHREQAEAERSIAYLGVNLSTISNKKYFGSIPASTKWRKVSLALDNLAPTSGKKLEKGMIIREIIIYAKAAGTSKKGLGKMQLFFDNLKLEVKKVPPLTSEINPPFFNWSKDIGPTTLEYSQNPKFPARATITKQCKYNFYTPKKKLKPGIWFYRLKKKNGTYTAPVKISISKHAYNYIIPAIPVAKITNTKRPYLIPIKKHSRLRKIKLQEEFKKLAAKKYEPSPKPFKKGESKYATWIEWLKNVHGGIIMQTGINLQKMADIYVQLGCDPQMEAELKKRLFHVAGWDVNGGSAHRYGDIGAYHIQRGMNWAYDALHDRLSEAERRQIRKVIKQRTEQVYKRYNPFARGALKEYNNHAWLCVFGVGESGLVLLGEIPEAEEWAEFCKQIYNGLFLSAQGYDGDNNEGVGYWVYGVNFLKEYADVLKHVTGIDLYTHPWLSRTIRYPIYCAPHNIYGVSFANVGNPNHALRAPLRWALPFIKELAKRSNDPYGLWYGGARAAEDGLTPKPPVDIPQSIWFRHIGWGIFNTALADGQRDVTVAMRSGKFFGGHQQEDQNSFVINAYGEKLAIDSGYYDYYGSRHFNEYSTRTKAHNTILVNDLGQDSRNQSANCKILNYFDGTGFGYMVGDGSNPHMYNGLLKKWKRKILFIKPDFVIIDDQLQASKKPVKIDWLLHAVAPFKINKAEQKFNFTSGKAKLTGRILSPEKLDFKVVYGYPVLPVTTHNNKPVPEDKLAKEWALYATAKALLQDDFLTAMRIEKIAKDAKTRTAFARLKVTNGIGAKITTEKSRIVVIFRNSKSKNNMLTEGLECNGDVAYIKTDLNENLISAGAVNATSLRFNGLDIMKADKRVNLSLEINKDGVIADISAKTKATCKVSYKSGESTRFKVGARKQQFIVAGKADKLLSRPIEAIKVNDTSFEGYAVREAERRLNYWWGTISCEVSAFYELTISGWKGAGKPIITCNTVVRELKKSGNNYHAVIQMSRGPNFILIDGYGRPNKISIKKQK
jgi:hypothetical protein